ncbi:MAG TPA: hypothetical protein VEH06_14100 [Candidatus Bathyarchaeia archaeon]|nr:hypothetical protein [Candidatus Bathyarchaeia archaeon]
MVELKPLYSKTDFQAPIMVTSVKPLSLGNRALIHQFVVKRVWKKKEATIERLLASFHRIKLRSITSEPVKLELNSVSFVHFDIDFNERDIVIKQRRIYLLIALGGLVVS